ncbi:hypothetical protein [Actinomadura sp. NEAU-AAG7]|uniref:hypothetical protein n=1 Tax=Actinomadura sp. NEAU-AAG7 TaxID=2839640 RepID=UPI001BE4AF92|nr:hypothetical protein [Actinomadura sp. NEAU-AAG7]MBT2210927.1 hypothetical protein [Actinomadura sp. NEAU-AAG7]
MTVATTAPPATDTDPSGRRVVVTVVAVQLAACLGFFAVTAHLVAHLRHDLGLLAGTVGLVLGVRVGLQYALLPPVGAVTDRLGARRTGAIACAVRALGFVLLGGAGTVGALLVAAVFLAVGGAAFAGDLVIGRLFDLGSTAATLALTGVGVSAFGARGPGAGPRAGGRAP